MVDNPRRSDVLVLSARNLLQHVAITMKDSRADMRNLRVPGKQNPEYVYTDLGRVVGGVFKIM